MTGNRYQVLAARTINKELSYHEKRNHAVFGIASEAGEISGILQKEYQGHKIDEVHLMKECGDLLWFIAELCTTCGYDLDTVMKMNIAKLRARYPEGFDEEHSLHRAEGDI